VRGRGGRRTEGGRPRCVRRDESRIEFLDKVNDAAVRDFLWVLAEARERGYLDLTLDFSRCDRAYPEAMLSLVCIADGLRIDNIGVDIELPTSAELARLYRNTNWAYCLEPARFEPVDFAHNRHIQRAVIVTSASNKR
jgi:hypothetical protein